jgi:hypothetical protein
MTIEKAYQKTDYFASWGFGPGETSGKIIFRAIHESVTPFWDSALRDAASVPSRTRTASSVGLARLKDNRRGKAEMV